MLGNLGSLCRTYGSEHLLTGDPVYRPRQAPLRFNKTSWERI